MNKTSSMEKTGKTINIAIQGGGAHGALSWGMLDRLLEDERINIEAVTATSAGSVNACALAYGMYVGGRERAKKALHDVWQEIYRAGAFYTPLKHISVEPYISWNIDYSPLFFFMDSISRIFSPYQLNPLNINPLRDILEKEINFSDIRKCDCMKLFISTTHVKTGKVRVFETNEINLDVVMASACLPFLFKAVEIDGEYYWDGGYMGNPTLFPLFYKTDSQDIMILHVNPMTREELPKSAPDIMNRVNEISFNSSLLREMRSIAFVKKLLENDMLNDKYKKDFKNVLVHSVRADDIMDDFSVTSKFNSDWDFLVYLHDEGYKRMGKWLDKHYDDLNVRDTVDLHEEFLNSVTDMFKHDTQKNGNG